MDQFASDEFLEKVQHVLLHVIPECQHQLFLAFQETSFGIHINFTVPRYPDTTSPGLVLTFDFPEGAPVNLVVNLEQCVVDVVRILIAHALTGFVGEAEDSDDCLEVPIILPAADIRALGIDCTDTLRAHLGDGTPLVTYDNVHAALQ